MKHIITRNNIVAAIGGSLVGYGLAAGIGFAVLAGILGAAMLLDYERKA